MQHATLSLVLPVRNAAAELGPLVLDAVRLLPQHADDYEIIIVDDGSSDETAAIALQLANKHDPVMLLSNSTPQGYGAALVRGLHSTRGDYVLALRLASGVHIGELSRLLPYSEQHALVSAYRLLPAGGRPLESLLQRLLDWLFPIGLRDASGSMTLLWASVLRQMPLTSRGILLQSELYIRARRRNIPSIQVGVQASLPRSAAIAAGYGHGRVRWQALLESLSLWLQLRGLVRARPATAPRISWRRRLALLVGGVAFVRVFWTMLRRHRL